MPLVHVADVARANLLAAVADASDIALNIGAGRETSLAELAGLLATVMGRPDLVPVHVEERAVNPVARRLADTQAARALIGFAAEIPLEAGLADLVAWWRGAQDGVGAVTAERALA